MARTVHIVIFIGLAVRMMKIDRQLFVSATTDPMDVCPIFRKPCMRRAPTTGRSFLHLQSSRPANPGLDFFLVFPSENNRPNLLIVELIFSRLESFHDHTTVRPPSGVPEFVPLTRSSNSVFGSCRFRPWDLILEAAAQLFVPKRLIAALASVPPPPWDANRGRAFR